DGFYALGVYEDVEAGGILEGAVPDGRPFDGAGGTSPGYGEENGGEKDEGEVFHDGRIRAYILAKKNVLRNRRRSKRHGGPESLLQALELKRQVFFRFLDHDPGEPEEADQVREGHEAVRYVGEGPDKLEL